MVLQANEGIFDEQDLMQFIGEAEEAQWEAEEGLSAAKLEINMLRAYMSINGLEAPHFKAQYCSGPAEVYHPHYIVHKRECQSVLKDVEFGVVLLHDVRSILSAAFSIPSCERSALCLKRLCAIYQAW